MKGRRPLTDGAPRGNIVGLKGDPLLPLTALI